MLYEAREDSVESSNLEKILGDAKCVGKIRSEHIRSNRRMKIVYCEYTQMLSLSFCVALCYTTCEDFLFIPASLLYFYKSNSAIFHLGVDIFAHNSIYLCYPKSVTVNISFLLNISTHTKKRYFACDVHNFWTSRFFKIPFSFMKFSKKYVQTLKSNIFFV